MKQVFDQILYDTALSTLNIPYRIGGSNPMAGFDCSGLVIYILQSAGVLDHGQDMTAQGLFDWFSRKGYVNKTGFGALAFYGKSAKEITHVGFQIDNSRMVHAGSGDFSTNTLETAIKQSAFVKVSPVYYRTDYIASILPMYPGRAIE